MADVAALVEGVVATDGARGRGEGVGGTEDSLRAVSMEASGRKRIKRRNLPRPVLTASRPSQTMAHMGWFFMSVDVSLVY